MRVRVLFLHIRFSSINGIKCGAMLKTSRHSPPPHPSFYIEKALMYDLSSSSLASNETDSLACAINRASETCLARACALASDLARLIDMPGTGFYKTIVHSFISYENIHNVFICSQYINDEYETFRLHFIAKLGFLW